MCVFVAGLMVVFFPTQLPAQKSAESVTTRIIDSQEVDLGDRSIIYNRVETPKLKTEEIKATSVKAEAVPMTAADEAAQKAWEAKSHYSLSLSVTVYDGNFSELRWWEDGQENIVWSNVNFLQFVALGDLETEGAYYWLMVWGWETTSEEMEAFNAEAKLPGEVVPLPPSELPVLGKAGPKWMAEGKLSDAASRAMEDFHEYCHLHGASMSERYKRQLAEAKASEEWVKANPPVPQDTIINFFPIRSVHAPKMLPVEETRR